MRIGNKKISHFKFEERLEAGIVLLGSEVKAVRLGHADITGSYVKILGNEAYLVNAKIFPYKFSRIDSYEEGRSRKLLLHKKEIMSLKSKLDQGNFTLVPIALYLKNGNFKIEIALAKGTKEHERKKNAKQKVLDRVAERELKYSNG